MPLFLSQMLIFEQETWFGIVFGYGYISGSLLYLLIQFDLNYEQRNNCNWHYMIFMVALSAGLGVSPSFRPKDGVVRIIYGLMLITAFLFFQIAFSNMYNFIYRQISWRQISTFEEIIESDFRLVGSREAFNVLNQSKKVMWKIYQITTTALLSCGSTSPPVF